MKRNFKFTIFGFQQERLLDAGLNSDDALVASVILDMYASEAIVSANIDGERYIWVSQRSLHQYIPIVGSEAKVRRIINNLIDKGLLVKKIKNVKNSRAGCYTFVKPTLEMSLLTEYMHSKEDVNQVTAGEALIQNDKGVLVKMTKAPYAKCANKDTPTTNSSTMDSKTYIYEQKNTDKPKQNKNSKQSLIKRMIENNVSSDVAEEFFDYRKTIKRNQLTDRALSAIINNCSRNNFPLEKALITCMERGWISFNYEWVAKGNTPNSSITKRESIERNNELVVDSIREKILRGEI